MSHAHRSLMARLAAAAALASTLVISAPAQAADVGVSISVNQPGFYGRVDIGDQRPMLIYPQPVIIHPGPYSTRQRPIYMRVPPGHYKQWTRYCGQYNACNQPVYFVNGGRPHPNAYAPTPRRDDHRMDRRGDRWDERRDHRHDDRGHPGKGKDKDRGHGHGHGHR
ncbi:MAG: hypothetical protein RBT42_13740 [Aquabacterium sp.]|uniref:hypothetical protein n=1 Tax=Aquabacterium sp. TaxID=1872578 RepID=UPI002A35E681|nr:hypothetical protein [Aquabacterium sp.]MDX9844804.1 hypothetical protein [Aquabacterium sp.]